MKDIVEITKEEAESFIGKPISEEEIIKLFNNKSQSALKR